MKRLGLVLAVLLGVVVLFGAVSAVSAQEPAPTPGEGNAFGHMGGWMRGRGMMGERAALGQGALHEYMQAAMAEKLGVSVETLESMHEEGKTFWQIAEEQGLTAEEAAQLKIDAHSAALDAAVADNAITQEQADWMTSRMSSGRMMHGAGGCVGGRGNGDASVTRGRGMMGGRW